MSFFSIFFLATPFNAYCGASSSTIITHQLYYLTISVWFVWFLHILNSCCSPNICGVAESQYNFLLIIVLYEHSRFFFVFIKCAPFVCVFSFYTLVLLRFSCSHSLCHTSLNHFASISTWWKRKRISKWYEEETLHDNLCVQCAANKINSTLLLRCRDNENNWCF